MAILRLELAWKSPTNETNIIYDHIHRFYEFVYYIEGSGTARIGENEYHFEKDHYSIISPFTAHSEIHECDGEVLCLGFFCDKMLSADMAVDKSGEILKIATAILDETNKQSYGYNEVITAKLNELYIQIVRNQMTNVSVPKNFDYTINYLSENFRSKLVFKDLAKQLSYSYDYFQHKFKSITGDSPQRFVLKKRLEAAKELLLASSLGCTEISYRCGFSTSAQFSMLFKKEYGIAPLQYRKRNKPK